MSREGVLGRRELIFLALVWLFFALKHVILGFDNIVSMNMPDPDDFLRLQQVRDWLAGQAWFDVSQHRINPPTGGAMHWTRLVDVPLALVITLLRPLIGQAAAELAASVAIPLATMGLVMLLVAAITARLVRPNWAPVAAAAAPLSGWIYFQTMPLRVDHHGWQVVAALTMFWALLDENRPRRSGTIAGAAAAVWLNISIEGLPVVAGAGALLGVRWLMDKGALPRLQMFVWTLACGCVLLETLTVASAWSIVECDRVSSPYVLALAVVCVGLVACRFKWLEGGWQIRFIALVAIAAVAASVFSLQGPQCLAGPFGALDPLTKKFWLDNVAESRPLWRLGFSAALGYGGYAAFGCVGAAWALRESESPEIRRLWFSAFMLCIVAAGLLLLVARAGGVAHAFAIPGAVYIAQKLFVRARASAHLLPRVAGTALALSLATPVPFQSSLALEQSTGSYAECEGQTKALSALPTGLIMAPLDIGSEIIANTPHSVVATGHHRNHAAMHDVISGFIGSDNDAHAVILSHVVRYVVLCPTAAEAGLYRKSAPQGFSSKLVRGKVPNWLEPVALGPAAPTLLAFRVRP